MLLIAQDTLQAHCMHSVGLGTQSQNPVSLGSMWQPFLKRIKRCMQRMVRGKSSSDLAWRPVMLANQLLYVQRQHINHPLL